MIMKLAEIEYCPTTGEIVPLNKADSRYSQGRKSSNDAVVVVAGLRDATENA
jgi:hypothetical protein